MHQSKTTILIALLLGALATIRATADTSTSKTTEWNGIKIECTATGGTIRFDESPEQCHVRMEFDKRITHSLLVTPDSLQLQSKSLGIDQKKKFEAPGRQSISLTATPNSLTLKFDEHRSSKSTSRSTNVKRTGSSSSSSGSSSTSTSKSSDVKSFSAANWNGKKIRLSIQGGNSVESSIEQNNDHCEIAFNIDKGKNKRVITLEPGALKIDGRIRHSGDAYSELFIDATGKSLAVKTDKGTIGSWKGKMGERVLRD